MSNVKTVSVSFFNGSFDLVPNVDHFSFSSSDVRLFEDILDGEGRPYKKRLVYAYPIEKVVSVRFVFEEEAPGKEHFVVVANPKNGIAQEFFYNDNFTFSFGENSNLFVYLNDPSEETGKRFFAVYNGQFVKRVEGAARYQRVKAQIEQDEEERRQALETICDLKASEFAS